MRLLGLDLSLTSTGWALLDGTEATTGRIKPGKLRGQERMRCLYSEAIKLAAGCDLVVVEGPSFGSPNKQHEMGGVWWVTTHVLWRGGLPIVVVPPACLKKYITGTGGASKDLVLSSVVRRYPQAPVSTNDEADALVLAAMAADRLGCPLAVLPAAQRAELDKWPDWERWDRLG